MPRASVSALDAGVMASPLVLDVDHAGLTVADLDDALVLWCSGLGFTLDRTFTLDVEVTAATTGVRGAVIRAATVTLGPHRVELLQYDPPRPPAPAPAPAPEGSPAQVGTVHVALTVSDLDRVLELCARHGWRPVGTPHLMTGGARAGTRIIYLEGALGGFLELIAPPGLP
ncbi:glyoxalase/bleomycin resistance/dioxygenase family protein [Curtobacterium sp. SGAir0571]